MYDLFNTEQRQRYVLPSPSLLDPLTLQLSPHADQGRSGFAEKRCSRVLRFKGKQDQSVEAHVQGVSVLHDGSEYSTDLQKCIEEVESAEKKDDIEVSWNGHA